MSERISEIRGRLALAVPGPWRVDGSLGPWAFIRDEMAWECAHAMQFRGRDNAPLIAHAPADLAWCCDEINRLRGLLAREGKSES